MGDLTALGGVSSQGASNTIAGYDEQFRAPAQLQRFQCADPNPKSAQADRLEGVRARLAEGQRQRSAIPFKYEHTCPVAFGKARYIPSRFPNN
jgi:hypothetical protein